VDPLSSDASYLNSGVYTLLLWMQKKPAPVGRWFIPFLFHSIPIYSHYLQCFKAIYNYPRAVQDFVTIHSMLLHGPTNFRSSDLDPPVGEHPSQRMLCKLGDGIRGWFAVFFLCSSGRVKPY
jgi:hypothetical protein